MRDTKPPKTPLKDIVYCDLTVYSGMLLLVYKNTSFKLPSIKLDGLCNREMKNKKRDLSCKCIISLAIYREEKKKIIVGMQYCKIGYQTMVNESRGRLIVRKIEHGY